MKIDLRYSGKDITFASTYGSGRGAVYPHYELKERKRNSDMKTIKILAATLLLGATAAVPAQAQIRFGVKAGANFNKLHLSDVKDNFTSDNGAGFTGGVMVEGVIPIIGLGLDASLMYTRMNSSVDVPVIPDGTTSGVVANGISSKAKNFFQIPINVKYKFSLPVVSSFLSPYLFTGPDFAFKLGGKDDVFETKTFQCAWNVGVGIELINHLQIQGSYGFGMNNVFEHVVGDAATTTSDFKTRNNYWTVTAAWLF